MHTLTLENTRNKNAFHKFFWEWEIWKEDYQKLSENLTSFFMEIFVRNKKGPETSY